MTCPLCSSQSSMYREIKGYPIYKCDNCGYQFLQNATDIHKQFELYDDRYFFGNQDGYINYLENKENILNQGRWYAELIKPYCSPGFMLDVGAAAGYVLKGFNERGWEGIGLEPSQTMVDYGNQKLGLNIEQGLFEAYQTEKRFDLIAMIQVVHHFYDVKSALDKAFQLLKPEGYLIIETWKSDSFVARLAGKRWLAYNPPTVRQWYTLGNIQYLVAHAGFKEIKHGLRHKKVKGKLLSNRVPKFMTRFIPKNWDIVYPGDDLFWIFFKKDSS